MNTPKQKSRIEQDDPRRENGFEIWLDRCGFSTRDLAEMLGMRHSDVLRWKDNPPKYAIAYMTLYARHRASFIFHDVS